MKRLAGKVAIVTGVGRASGIGAAVARRLAQEGADLVLADLCGSPAELPNAGGGSWDELQAIAQEAAVHGVRCLPLCTDVTKPESVQAMVASTSETMGRLDILVNNAGVSVGPAPVLAMEEEAWRRTLEVNATGTFFCCKYALPLMIETSEGGRVINMASLAAERPKPYVSAYAASKAAVVALTRSLAQEVASLGITANAVLPGDIDTALKQWGLQLEAAVVGRSYEEVVAAAVARIPVGRMGTPEDVASLVAFLASDEASFITGQAYILSGGRELG